VQAPQQVGAYRDDVGHGIGVVANMDPIIACRFGQG
jgi:hypothetical protein